MQVELSFHIRLIDQSSAVFSKPRGEPARAKRDQRSPGHSEVITSRQSPVIVVASGLVILRHETKSDKSTTTPNLLLRYPDRVKMLCA